MSDCISWNLTTGTPELYPPIHVHVQYWRSLRWFPHAVTDNMYTVPLFLYQRIPLCLFLWLPWKPSANTRLLLSTGMHCYDIPPHMEGKPKTTLFYHRNPIEMSSILISVFSHLLLHESTG